MLTAITIVTSTAITSLFGYADVADPEGNVMTLWEKPKK